VFSPNSIKSVDVKAISTFSVFRPRKGLDFYTPEKVIEKKLGIKVHTLFRRA